MDVMQRITFLSIQLTFWFMSICTSNANPTDLKSPLKVGDKVPDIHFTNVINFKDTEVKLSNFKGKAVILDFWATWCGTCIEKIPLLDAYQKEFAKDLQILLVANDDESRVRAFFAKRPELILPSEVVSSESTSTYLQSLFPHLVVPHYAWINKEGYLVAVTGTGEVTKENIKAFIAGRLGKVETKTDSLQINSVSGMVVDSIYGERAKRISINPLITFQSMVTKFDWRVSPGLGRSNKTDNIRFVDLCNLPISTLYWYAFLGLDNYSSTNQMLIETKDSVMISYPDPKVMAYESSYNSWLRTNCYSYRLITQKSVDSISFMKRMQQDIIAAFGYQVKFEEREEMCYVLKLNEKSKNLMSKTKVPVRDASASYIQLLNVPISALIQAISNHTGILFQRSSRMPKLNIIDETGLTNNIDLTLKGNLKDTTELQRALRNGGIDLIKTVRRQKFLVMTDKVEK